MASRADAPGGLGYALENRLVVAQTFPESFGDMRVARLAAFFNAYKESILELGVSRRHGMLHFDNGRLYYTDLKSSNGSRVNGAGLYSEIPVALEDGDEICLGKVAFRVYFGP